MSHLETGFATTHDGETVAYKYHPAKTGNPAIIMSNGVGCTDTFYCYMTKHFAGRYPVINWDYRGHGDSPVPSDIESVTMENHARDVAAVLDALEIKKAIHFGFSMGVQAGFEFYKWFPERTVGLVAICGPFEKPYDVFFGNELFSKGLIGLINLGIKLHKALDPIRRLVLLSPLAFPVAKLVQVDPCLTRKEDMEPYFDHYANIDMPLALTALKKMNDHSARDILPTVTVPTLIVAGDRDTMTPIETQEEMRSLLPDSRLIVIPKGTHAAPIEQPQAINYGIELWLRDKFDLKAP